MDDDTAARVDRLFARFAAIYGQRWIKPLEDPAIEELARHEWAPAISALTDEQIRAGIDACKAGMHEWPPTFGEFVRLALGLPEVHKAVAAAAKGDGDLLSRAIRKETGDSYNVRMMDARSAQKACSRAYHEVVRRMVSEVNCGLPVTPDAFLQAELDYAKPMTGATIPKISRDTASALRVEPRGDG